MSRHQRGAESADSEEYPDSIRGGLIVRLLGVMGLSKKDGMLLVSLLTVGGGGAGFYNHHNSAVESKMAEHSAVLGGINDRLGKLDIAVAVLQTQGAQSVDQQRQMNALLNELTKAVYRQQGRGGSVARE